MVSGSLHIHTNEYLTLWAEPVAFWLSWQFEALGVVHPGAELTAEHLALAVAQPAVEIIPAVLRYNIDRKSVV